MRTVTRVTGYLIVLAGWASAAGVAPHPDWENALAPHGRRGPTLTLAVAGKTAYTILLPERPTGPEQRAAEDLARWLQEMTGSTSPVVP